MIKFGFYSVALLAITSCAAPTANTPTSAVIRYDSIHHPVIHRGGMVVSQNAIASQVGADILEQGGSAVDAAIATGFALAVTLPRAGNIGGGGFALVHIDGEPEPLALDFRGVAPAAFDPDGFRGEDGQVDKSKLTYGPKAGSVPGTVAGFYHLWQRYGELPWKALLRPAIRLARQGIIVSDDLAFVLRNSAPTFRRYPSSAAIFLKADGANFQPGERLIQTDLASSLSLIAVQGASTFYSGELGTRLTTGLARVGGYIRAEDLKQYEVRPREIIGTNYAGYRVFSMPAPSSGGLAVLQMLNVLSELDLTELNPGSAETLHVLAEVMKRGAANRRGQVGDPDFVAVPQDDMLSQATAEKIAASISLTKALPTDELLPYRFEHHKESPIESRDTTHISVVDKDRNAVSITYTLGYSFGSGFVAPGTGILLDNQMRNFVMNHPNHANHLLAGKRMASSMTPVMVLDSENEVRLVTGSPGGSRIPNVVLQILVNHLQFDLNIAEATSRPRIHQGWPGAKLFVEAGISRDTQRLLTQMGHDIAPQKTMGSTQSIAVRDGLSLGSADPRRPGALAIGTP